MVVRIEYDRSNRVCIRRTGNRLSHAVDQGANFFCRGQAPLPSVPSLAPVLEPARRSLRLSHAPPTVHTRCSFAVRSRTSDLLVYAADVYTYFILVFHHPSLSRSRLKPHFCGNTSHLSLPSSGLTTDSPDCLPVLLSISVFYSIGLLFLFFHFLVVVSML